jgi:aldehyde dehydrogenase family 7 protein A1
MSQQLTYANYPFLKELGIDAENYGCYYDGKWSGRGNTITTFNPTTNEPIANVKLASGQDYEDAIAAMERGQNEWMLLPPPQRGEIVRQIGEAFRLKK